MKIKEALSLAALPLVAVWMVFLIVLGLIRMVIGLIIEAPCVFLGRHKPSKIKPNECRRCGQDLTPCKELPVYRS